MIDARFEPKGLSPDAEPLLDAGAMGNRRHDAATGSSALLDAILRAASAQKPRPTAPTFTPPKRERGRPLGSCKARHIVTKIIRIQSVVAAHFGIPAEEMTSDKKHFALAHPRQVAMYLARKTTFASSIDIGDHFGGRDHTTVLHAVKAVEQRIAKGDERTILALIAAHEGGIR